MIYIDIFSLFLSFPSIITKYHVVSIVYHIILYIQRFVYYYFVGLVYCIEVAIRIH